MEDRDWFEERYAWYGLPGRPHLLRFGELLCLVRGNAVIVSHCADQHGRVDAHPMAQAAHLTHGSASRRI